MISTVLALALVFAGATAAPADAPPAFEDILKIDFHAHIFDDIPELAPMLERTNMRIVDVCTYDKPEYFELAEQRVEELHTKYGPYIQFCSTFDHTKTQQPDFAATSIEWLDKSFAAGAVMTKLWKNIGMKYTKDDGQYILPDDPALDPIYDHLAKCGKPLLSHCADPIDAWRPLNKKSMHYGYYSKNTEWYVYGRKDVPHHDDLMAARDNVMAKHPDLMFVAAHLGSLEHDLDALARRLDFFPNMYTDLSARVYVLRQMPLNKVHDFIVKYQDRILYATDADKFTPQGLTQQEREEFVAGLEKAYRNDFDYFVNTVKLPREALEKIYSKNALKLAPALAEK